MEWEDILERDLSGFELSTGAYYLCRHDFFELVDVGRLTPDWFTILVGDTIDYTEIRGWRKIGRPKRVNPSFTELKTVRCIIDGPQLEDIYMITELSKPSIGDKTVVFTSSLLEGEMKSGTRYEIIEEAMEESGAEEFYDCISTDEMFYDCISTFDEILTEEADPYSHPPPPSFTQVRKLIIQEPKLESERMSKGFLPIRGSVKKRVFNTIAK
ncbi:uncharacterized protein LOC143546521 [Bidens hawaiensis]|uniref:uncharacterized protein LOC143546521 n=1 Tax=Bidens hawaiensis TaxID=980011 RepID=UPI004049AE78